MDGRRAPLPRSWVTCIDGSFCLGCRRQRAAQAAVEAAPPGEKRSGADKLRRAGLLEFEVLRTPDSTNNVIARACHSSVAAVAAARRRVGATKAEG
jgi:hypothetical protein